MKQYADLLRAIKENGTKKGQAREGMPITTSLFGYQFRHDLSEGFPLITTKKMYWKGVIAELIWFLKGDTNVKFLDELGVRKMWHEDAYNYYKKIASVNGGPEQNGIMHDNEDGTCRMFTFEEFCEVLKTTPREALPSFDGYTLGSCGSQYGKLWRNWNDGIDQVANVINGLRANPESRRHIVTAWDPSELDNMALHPCHALFQFNCRPLTSDERFQQGVMMDLISDKSQVGEIKELMESGQIPSYKLDCQLYQRSADVFLGVPFNIASYALLTHLIAQMCNMVPGDFIHTFGDVHIYENHMEQVNEQLTREPYKLPEVRVSSRFSRKTSTDVLESLGSGDFFLIDYRCHPKIEAELSTGLKK